MTALTPGRLRNRYLLLHGLRWLPVGLLIPVMVLLPLERGLSLAEFGTAIAAQGVVVLALELPTGGLSDAVGRRPVLLMAGVVGLVALGVLVVADTFTGFLVVGMLQGVYRALDSGPLEAWYIDHVLAGDPDADIESGLSRGGIVIGVAIAVGALGAGGLIVLGPLPLGPYGVVTALTVPVLVACLLQAVSLVAVAVLLTEARPARGVASLAASVLGVPLAVGSALLLLRRSRVVLALVSVQLFWGFGMVTFEVLMPVRLAEVMGRPEQAAALLGPAGSAGWLASAAGAALAPLLVRRIGPASTGAVLRVVHGVTVLAMGLFAGPVGVIASYLLCYTVNGAASPVHSALLHRQVDGPYRSSLISLNSMVVQPAGALGAVMLTTIAVRHDVTLAIIVGAAVLTAAAPLYLLAGLPRTRAGPADRLGRAADRVRTDDPA